MSLAEVQKSVAALAREYPFASTFLLGLGFLSVAKVAFKTLVVFLQIFILPGTNLKKFGAKKGAWAIVTGASDGIGKEFAFQLGKAGFNVLLVARNEETLKSVAGEIGQKYSDVSTGVYSIDFAKADDAAYDNFAKHVEKLDVGVLVNNVGKSHSMPVDFAETPLEELRDIPAINVNGTLRVTHAALPGMVQRRRGLILNIGSFAGAVPSPMLATYSGTKAFLSTFSDALDAEVRSKGVVVQHINTFFVVSKLSKIRRPSLFTPTPQAYVKAVLGKVGLAAGSKYSGRPASSTPYWSHAVMDYVINLIDQPWIFIKYTIGLHKDIRRRALRKAAREAKQQ